MNIIKNEQSLIQQIGSDIAKEGGSALLAISPGNSYFSRDILKEMMEFCEHTFSRTDVMVMDLPSLYNFRALGYSESKSQKKVKRATNYMRNKLGSHASKMMDWNMIYAQDSFNKELDKLVDLYETNESFRVDVRNATRPVVQNTTLPLEEAVEIGSRYLLEELSLFSIVSEITGAPRTAIVYHKDWPVMENYFAGKYCDVNRDNVGYVVLR